MNSRTGIGVRLLGCEWRNRRPRRRRIARALLLSMALSLAHAVFGAHSPQVLAADAAPATGSASAAPATPAVEEWLNQSVRLRETLQAMSRPSADGKPSGEIRAGAEVKAIGLVADKHWVEIELPDHSLAYVPQEAIEYEGNPAVPAPAPDHQRAASPVSPAPPTSASTASSAPPAAAAHAPGPEVLAASAPGAIRGKIAGVPNSATLVVGDQRLRLSGIDPGPVEVLGPFESWVRGQGDIACEPDAQTGRYHCFTSGGVDVAEAAILNGAGRVGDGATPEYRDSETQARTAKRGLWGQP